jgi:hypothetical protein
MTGYGVIGYIPARPLKARMEAPSDFVCGDCGYKARTWLDAEVHKRLYEGLCGEGTTTDVLELIKKSEDAMMEYIVFDITTWHGPQVHDPFTRGLRPGWDRCLKVVCKGDVDKLRTVVYAHTVIKFMHRKQAELFRLRKESLPTDEVHRDLSFFMRVFMGIRKQLEGWGLWPLPETSTWLYDKPAKAASTEGAHGGAASGSK